METPSHAFPPVIGENPRLLLLGSMPGQKSLQDQQYYAHPRNQFWPIMGEIFGAGPDIPYAQRLEILKRHHIALWDVIAHCIRPGSLDSSIKDAVTNNFCHLFQDYPSIRYVFFNSGTAEKIYNQTVLPKLADNSITYLRLPSPSPAYAGMRFEEKLRQWRRAFDQAGI